MRNSSLIACDACGYTGFVNIRYHKAKRRRLFGLLKARQEYVEITCNNCGKKHQKPPGSFSPAGRRLFFHGHLVNETFE